MKLSKPINLAEGQIGVVKMQARVARLMAWERAKGELSSLIPTYVWKEGDELQSEAEALAAKIKIFIDDVEMGYLGL